MPYDEICYQRLEDKQKKKMIVGKGCGNVKYFSK